MGVNTTPGTERSDHLQAELSLATTPLGVPHRGNRVRTRDGRTLSSRARVGGALALGLAAIIAAPAGPTFGVATAATAGVHAGQVLAVPGGLAALTPAVRAQLPSALLRQPAVLERLRCPAHDLILPTLPGACSHGADSRGAFVISRHNQDGHQQAATTSSGTTTQESLPLRCIGGDGNRVQVLYAHASGRGRLSRVLPQLNQALGEANSIVSRSAQQTGGHRQLAVLTPSSGSTCSAQISDVTVSGPALNDLSELIRQAQSQGYTRQDRKYLVFGDGTTSFCGIGTLYEDDRNTPMNINNLGGSFALAGNGQGCWDGVVVAHELLHTLGGVQQSAPNSTPGNHCTDGADVMCYDDGSSGAKQQRRVCGTANANRLDCHHDDYFNTAPRAGSYLATHWNTASSSFLIGGGIAAPVPPGAPADLVAQTPEQSSDSASSSDLALSWSAATGRVTSYQLSLPDGSVVTLPAQTRSYNADRPDPSRDSTFTLVAINEAGPGPAASVTVAGQRSSVFSGVLPPLASR